MEAVGEGLLEFLPGGLAQLGQLQPVADGRIGDHDAGPAGVGDHGQPPAAGQRLHRIKRGIVEQLGDRIHPLHAALGEHGVVDRIGAGQRAGVAGDGLGALGRAARLQAEHWLVGLPEDVADRLDEPPPVAHVLQIHGDNRGLFVLRQIVQQVDLVDVGLVAEADELAEAHVAFLGVIENRGAQGTALREKGQVAGLGHLTAEGGVHRDLGIGIDHSQAIGPDQGDAGRPDLVAKLGLQGRPSGADFLETGGDHHQGLDTLGNRLVDHAENRHGRDDQHGQVDRHGNGRQVRIGMHAANRRGLGIDRIDRTGEFGVNQVAKNIVADGARPGGSADHGDRLRTKDGVEFRTGDGMLGHAKLWGGK